MKNMKDSPSIPQRVLVEQESGSDVLISTPAWLALAKKAGKSDVPLSVLEQVYARGIVTAEPHPKNTPEQQAFHRIDSFIHEGKAYELDNDLTEVIKVPDGKKHMDVIKAAIKHHEERNKPEPDQVNELNITRVPLPLKLAGAAIGGVLRKRRSGYWTKKGEQESIPYRAKQIADRKSAEIESNKILKQRYPEKDGETSKGPKRSLVNQTAREVFGQKYTALKATDLAARLARKKEYESNLKRQKNAPAQSQDQDVTPGGTKFGFSKTGAGNKGWNAQRSEAEKRERVGYNSRRKKVVSAVFGK